MLTWDNMKQTIYFGIFVILFPWLSIGLDINCCRKPPPLIINGKNIFHEMEGNHILVAFVEGNKKESKKQVRVLDLMLNNFQNMDVLDIKFLAINKKNDSGIRHLRRKAAFDIYHEPETSKVWEELGVGTNDFVIFDHCGYMVGYMPYPENFLRKAKARSCTDKLIRNTYTKLPCKKYWKCIKQEQKIVPGLTPDPTPEPQLFSIVELNNGTYNSPFGLT